MLRIIIALSFLLSIVASAEATITSSGSVLPGDPNSWTFDAGGSIGGAADGSVTIDGGSLLQVKSLSIGLNAGNEGILSVDGEGSSLETVGGILGGIRIAILRSTGLLSVTNGGAINSGSFDVGVGSGSQGSITVDGLGSRLNLGGSSISEVRLGALAGNGILSISNGATVTSYATLIGYTQGGTGMVTVTGVGSMLTNTGPLTVGYGYASSFNAESFGQLTISEGATVRSQLGVLGDHEWATGVAAIDGVGTTWITEGVINVGAFGNGHLAITGGAAVESYWGLIGAYNPPGNGEAIVSGPGSIWTCRNGVYIGNNSLPGSGVLTISNSGLVKAAVIEPNGDLGALNTGSDGIVKMGSGGSLALEGDAEDSLDKFLELVTGTDDIRYRDRTSGNWENIRGATSGVDYALQYYDAGELTGYTVLTVFAPVPEPATTVLLLLALFAMSGDARLLRR